MSTLKAAQVPCMLLRYNLSCQQQAGERLPVISANAVERPCNYTCIALVVSDRLNSILHSCMQALLLYLISPVAPNKPPQVPPNISWGSLDLDHLLLQAGLISAGEHTDIPVLIHTYVLVVANDPV